MFANPTAMKDTLMVKGASMFRLLSEVGTRGTKWTASTAFNILRRLPAITKAGFDMAHGAGKLAFNIGKGAFNIAAGAAGAIKEGGQKRRALVYLKSKEFQRFYQKLNESKLFDLKTGSMIKVLKDIKDTCVDDEGNLYPQALDYVPAVKYMRSGLASKGLTRMMQGVHVLGSRAVSMGANALSILSNLPGAAFGVAKTVAKFAWGHYDVYSDVYVAGETSPRLKAHLIREGEYIRKSDGKPVLNYKDINGEILDTNGKDVLLDRADIERGLVDYAGKPLKTGLTRLVGGALHLGKMAIVGAAKTAMWLKNMAVSGAKALGLGASKLFGLIDGPLITFFGTQRQVVSELQKIYKLLDERIPKRVQGYDDDTAGNRVGSWEAGEEGGKNGAPGKGYNSAHGAALAAQGEAAKGNGSEGKGSSMGQDIANDVQEAKDTVDLVKDVGKSLPKFAKGIKSIGAGIRDAINAAPFLKRLFKIGNVVEDASVVAGEAEGATAVGTAASAATAATTAVAAGSAVAEGAAISGTVAAAGAGGVAGVGTLAALVSNPVGWTILGVSAVGIAAYGGYKLFKSAQKAYKRITEPDSYLLRLRIKEYGVNPLDDDKVKAILTLESYLSKKVKAPKDKMPYIPDGSFNVRDLMDPFCISENDTEHVNSWGMWYANRFKPIYLAFISASSQLGKSTDISNLDDNLSRDDRMRVVAITRLTTGPNSPYAVTASPWADGSPLEYFTKDIIDEMDFSIHQISNQSNKISEGKDALAHAKAAKSMEEKESTWKRAWEATKGAIGDDWKAIRKGANWLGGKAVGLASGTIGFVAGAFGAKAQQLMGLGHAIVNATSYGAWAAATVAIKAANAASKAYTGTHGSFINKVVAGGKALAMSLSINAKDNEKVLIGEMLSSGIVDKTEQAMFLAQMYVESGGFTKMSESFAYKPDRLMQISKTAAKLGKTAVTMAIVQGPEAVGDLLYGGRMGNGNPGDGYRYRGRGFVQLTGRTNYAQASAALGIDLLGNPDQASIPSVAAKIAVWYWRTRVNAKDALAGDVEKVTKQINGGLIDLDQRRSAFTKFLQKANSPEGILGGTDDLGATTGKQDSNAPASATKAPSQLPGSSVQAGIAPPTAKAPAPTGASTQAAAAAARGATAQSVAAANLHQTLRQSLNEHRQTNDSLSAIHQTLQGMASSQMVQGKTQFATNGPSLISEAVPPSGTNAQATRPPVKPPVSLTVQQ